MGLEMDDIAEAGIHAVAQGEAVTLPGATIDAAALADIERTVQLWQDARLPPREVWHAITGYWRQTAKWHDVRALMWGVVIGSAGFRASA